MTLGRLILAWLPVAVLFLAVWPADPRFGAVRPAVWTVAATVADTGWRWRAGARVVESVVLTLLASLWFDSLGHGGWWLVFGLVGALVGLPRLWLGADLGRELRGLALDLARYIAAGGLLAWRLG